MHAKLDRTRLAERLDGQIEFAISAEMDHIPVRGNALASGDDAEDKRVEDEIFERLNSGDVWAWASVHVTATFGKFVGHDYLGGCCYKDESDFCQDGGYWESMKEEAFKDLLERMLDAHQAVENAYA